jgi:hypothetical protein
MPIRPPGRADPQQLGGAVPRVATGQVLAGGQHRLEGAVGEGEVLGLALQERHLQPFGLGAPAGPLQQVGVAVDPDDPAEAARRGQGGVPAAAAHVQHTLTGVQVDRLAQELAGEQDPRPDGGVRTRRPDRPLGLLDDAELHGLLLDIVYRLAASLTRLTGSGQVMISMS